MIWLAWRQQRATILTIAGVLVGYVIAIVVLRQQSLAVMADALRFPNVASISFKHLNQYFSLGNAALLGIPPLVGAFVGAPLFARDREQGTDVLVLTQSVSATRRFATKLAFALVPVLIATIVAQVVHFWWATSLRPFEPREFTLDARAWLDLTGPVPLAFTVFAVVLGGTLGLLLGNTLSAMALTFGIVLGAQVADRTFLRDFVDVHPDFGGGRWITL